MSLTVFCLSGYSEILGCCKRKKVSLFTFCLTLPNIEQLLKFFFARLGLKL